MRRVAIYSRVSTKDQSTDNQTRILSEILKQNNWELVDVYLDHGVSGSKGREQRPEFDRLWDDMLERKFDTVMVWDITRLGRSLQNLIEFLNAVHSVPCDLYIHQQGLDTSTPTGRMMFQMVGVFAEFERSMISERVKSGLQRVRSTGIKLGRPTRQTSQTVSDVWSLKDNGRGPTSISKQLNLGRTTVYRILSQERPDA